MSVAAFDNITLTVWPSGIQIQNKDTGLVTFIARHMIGSVSANADSLGSHIRYIPASAPASGPLELVTWYSEDTPNTWAFKAFEFILEWLYGKPSDVRDSMLYT
jgi:hypothetical protein